MRQKSQGDAQPVQKQCDQLGITGAQSWGRRKGALKATGRRVDRGLEGEKATSFTAGCSQLDKESREEKNEIKRTR